MLPYVAKRLGQSLLTIFLTVSTVFVLIRMAPGDPAYALAGPLATTGDLEKIRTSMGLNEPLITQYGIFLKELGAGNIGKSYSFQAPALEVVLSRLPNTIFLAVLAILLAIVVAIPLGVWMAKRADTKRELGVNVLTIAGQSMPDFWIGIMLLTLFAVMIPIFPSSGFTSWAGVVLPVTTVAILQIALVSRMVRREVGANMAAPYLTVAGPAAPASRSSRGPTPCATPPSPSSPPWGPGSRACSTAWWWLKWCSTGPASARWWCARWKPATTP
jgi:peptide/nickel transport system permease protein